MQQLMARLRELQAARPQPASRFGPDWAFHGGLETWTVPERYSWHGLRRGGDPRHPFVIFQYTLAGAGRLELGGVSHTLEPGMAFTVVVPSNHHYFLPRSSGEWTLFYLVLRHPYVVERIARSVQTTPAVFSLAPDALLIGRATQLLEGMYQASYYDCYAEEEGLFSFMLEYERHAQRRLYPPAERDQLLDAVRAQVYHTLESGTDVAEIAASFGLSRSHFSHRFKAQTGLTPAQFITRIRLEEVAHRLLSTDHPLATVAAATGFANTNHLCKLFRRYYHQSPTQFRRQLR